MSASTNASLYFTVTFYTSSFVARSYEIIRFVKVINVIVVNKTFERETRTQTGY